MAVRINKSTIIFIIDTSGSMYGQKIVAVNAAIAECAEVVRNYDKNSNLQIGYATFDERWGGISLKKNIDIETFKITANPDGFYRLTSFQVLYEGLENELCISDNNCCALCLVLVTDGKPADSGEYTDVLERVKSTNVFRYAERFVALVGNDVNGMDNDVLEFVGFKADRVVKLNDAASALLKVSFLSTFGQGSDTGDAAIHDSIFGD